MIQFPKDFYWGAATASYQIEGADHEDGRGECIWDRYCSMPGNILDGSSGVDGCDHYHRWEEDIELMKQLGLKTYRLSIAWPRILPEGKGEVNQKGIEFYRKLLTRLHEAGIRPAVTLYHWDLPQKLQDIGGWMNEKISDYFAEYAKVIYRELGDLIPSVITLNEPYCSAFLGYWTGRHAPGYQDFSSALLASHNLLLAHGKAVQAYRESGLKGEIGITLNMNCYYPASSSPADADAAELSHAAFNRWFYDPIFKGEYPAEVLDLYRSKGIVLPDITKEDLDIIHTPIDFLGLNNYFSMATAADEKCWPLGVAEDYIGEERTEMGWGINPQGIRDLLIRLHKDCGGIKMYVTENGAAFRDMVNRNGEVEDDNRIEFLYRYLTAVHEAIESGVNLKGYYLWSLMDNFEWALGYTKRFGIIYVDYHTKQRIIKKSGYWYRDVIANNGF